MYYYSILVNDIKCTNPIVCQFLQLTTAKPWDQFD